MTYPSKDLSVAAATPPGFAEALPDEPLKVIEPRTSWLAIDFAELRQYRELLYFLTWRDVKVHYRQAALGVTWAVLQPLLLMAIFTIFYSRLARVETGGVPYPLFAYAGVVLWTFFANAITASGNSLINNVNLITKVYFPRMLVPAAAVAACLLHLAIASVVLIGMMLYYRVTPGARLLLLPPLILLTVLFATAVGLWTAALNVKYRDVRLLLPFGVQVWLLASSVIVPSSAVPQQWRWVPRINPMSAFIEGFRAILFGGSFDTPALVTAVVITTIALLAGVIVFRAMERSFADVI
ncbi:MAG TPA: ABC transporter permease [Thermoanaerobaculia bacterium]|jgi:lipopolysaccharide transport system permease protein|nr:ABC transporter permease [Thermoanaerobaculia bacterium]